MDDQVEDINRKIKKNQMEIFELKNTTTEITAW